MTSDCRDELEHRVLVLAPTGRDAPLVMEVLGRAGIATRACDDMAQLCQEFARGAGAILLSEEALTATAIAQLALSLRAQPPWSDIPILVCNAGGETTEARLRAIRALNASGNFTVLERPGRIFTMVIAVQAALRARRRQLQMRDLLARQVTQVDELRTERELRTRFVTLLAHDLRGPLSAAKLGLHRLITHADRIEKPREVALKIDKNLDRIERMVRDLLDVSRLQAGQRLALALEACELVTIAAEVIEELNGRFGERLRLRGETRVEGIWSPDELRRAIWNLANNAIKYGAPDSTIRIDVGQHHERAQVSIHNLGRPISPEEQQRIFEPFARTHSAETGASGGWGLGLTLVRGCAEAHGGHIRVTSDAERGTTFTLEIPLDARPHQPTADRAEPSSGQSPH
jgi:signal transduction histidine kinase